MTGSVPAGSQTGKFGTCVRNVTIGPYSELRLTDPSPKDTVMATFIKSRPLRMCMK
jgi:hypothetical protein